MDILEDLLNKVMQKDLNKDKGCQIMVIDVPQSKVKNQKFKALSMADKIKVVGLGIGAIVLGYFSFAKSGSSVGDHVETLAKVKHVDTTDVVSDIASCEYQLEAKLESILRDLKGAGNVRVRVTIGASAEQVFAIEKNTKTQQNKLIMQNNEPIVLKEKEPQVTGVLVLAEGANDPAVRQNIVSVVNSLTKAGTDHIIVNILKGGAH